MCLCTMIVYLWTSAKSVFTTWLYAGLPHNCCNTFCVSNAPLMVFLLSFFINLSPPKHVAKDAFGCHGSWERNTTAKHVITVGKDCIINFENKLILLAKFLVVCLTVWLLTCREEKKYRGEFGGSQTWFAWFFNDTGKLEAHWVLYCSGPCVLY